MAKIATYAPNVFSHQMRTLLESGTDGSIVDLVRDLSSNVFEISIGR
jgi:hypothetical protein